MSKRLIFFLWVFIAIVWTFIGAHKLFGECGWLAPKVVEFRQGMTLCPGQSARMTIKFSDPGMGI